MTYLFYPYFWGRKSQWQGLALQTSIDADFLDFLKAGSARVVVPIRPTFEPLALFYLMTGQIWGGGGLNGISDAGLGSFAPLAYVKESVHNSFSSQGLYLSGLLVVA